MEVIKKTVNLEFDVIYADGTRCHVTEGVLLGVEDGEIIIHNGTNRPEVVFAAARAIRDFIKAMTIGGAK